MALTAEAVQTSGPVSLEAKRERTVDLVLGDIQSDFLCAHCGNLLYLGTSDEPEVCLNKNCKRWPFSYLETVDPRKTGQPRVDKVLIQQEERILGQIKSCDVAELRRFAYEERRRIIQSFFEDGAMLFVNKFLALGELLILTQRLGITRLHTAGSAELSKFQKIIQQVTDWAGLHRYMEDLRTGRFRLLRRMDGTIDDNSPYRIKYDLAVHEAELTMGLVSKSGDLQSDALFRYSIIEQQATPDVPPTPTDLADILERFWPTTLQLRQGLRYHYRTSVQYGYTPNPLDMSVLVGWCLQLWPEANTGRIPIEKEKDEIDRIERIFVQYPELGRSSADFVAEYVDSKCRVPLVVRVPDAWLLDKWTLFFFILHLMGSRSLRTSTSVRLNEPLLDRMRGRAGQEFELWLRSELDRAGFRGPDCPVRVGFEYDILRISEEKKSIVLADAKYRDVNPSSFTGENLIRQELTGDHALLDEAARQQERLGYFRANPDQFRRHLEPERPWADYKVASFVITKHIPLISKYKETAVVRAKEFLQSMTQCDHRVKGRNPTNG